MVSCFEYRFSVVIAIIPRYSSSRQCRVHSAPDGVASAAILRAGLKFKRHRRRETQLQESCKNVNNTNFACTSRFIVCVCDTSRSPGNLSRRSCRVTSRFRSILEALSNAIEKNIRGKKEITLASQHE